MPMPKRAECLAWLLDEGAYNHAKTRESKGGEKEFYVGRASMCLMIADKLAYGIGREELAGAMQQIANSKYATLKH